MFQGGRILTQVFPFRFACALGFGDIHNIVGQC